MKALTLHQPYATLIALGVKRIETRSWPAPASLIGERIAIHAAKTNASIRALGPANPRRVGSYSVTATTGGEFSMIRLRSKFDPLRRKEEWVPLPLGAVVATARLEACLPINWPGNDPESDEDLQEFDPVDRFVCAHVDGGLTHYEFDNGGRNPATRSDDIDDQLPFGVFTRGRWAWMLTDVQPCDPIPGSGQQRLWNWEAK